MNENAQAEKIEEKSLGTLTKYTNECIINTRYLNKLREQTKTESEEMNMNTNQNNNTNETTVTNCTQCPKHCPIDQMQCGRGQKMMAEMSGQDKEERVRQEGHHGRGRRRDDGAGERHGHEGHGRHQRREHGKDCGSYDPDSLQGLMRQCGHIIYHGSQQGSGQENILSILAKRESMSQRELQEMLNIQAGSMSEILSKLENKGFLLRAKADDDKRKMMLTITEQGKEKAAEALSNPSEDLFAVLSQEEQEQLKSLLRKVLGK